MDFAQRGLHQQSNPAQGAAPSAPSQSGGHGKSTKGGPMWSRVSAIVLLISGGILMAALILFIVTGSTGAEGKYVAGNQYQAVFLNGGQVYFGKIKTLNNKYLRIRDIYYLRVNQTVQPNQSSNAQSNDVSLVKLGCELHGPQDEMLVNRDQVIFWENLKSDGQVAKAVAEYQKQNPNGQKCDTTTTNTTDTTKKP